MRAVIMADAKVEMKADFSKFLGEWRSESGQRLIIRAAPIVNALATYHPADGEARYMLRCYLHGGCLQIALSIMGHLEAMLLLEHQRDANTGHVTLLPLLEQGPESDWSEADFGFPWVMPLSPFHRQE